MDHRNSWLTELENCDYPMAMLTIQMVISEFRGSMSPIFVEIGLHTFVNGCAIGSFLISKDF
jgi:hypothetical protein